MIGFDFDAFGREKRISISGLAGKLKKSYISIYNIWKRRTVKPELLKDMENKFGVLSKYIIK
jgi:hypothetical protein